MKNPESKMMLLIAGLGLFMLIVIGLALWLTWNGPEPEEGNPKPDASSSGTAHQQPEESPEPEAAVELKEDVNVSELEPLENPFIAEEEKEILGEEEWNVLSMQVDALLNGFEFQEANDLLNEKTKNVALEEVPYGEELNKLRFDVNNLSFLRPGEPLGYSEHMGHDGAVSILQLMQDPKRALLAVLSAANPVRIEGILHQNSLVPIFEGEPTIEKVRPYPAGEYTRMLQGSYPDHTYHLIYFTLEAYPLQAIVIEDEQGIFRIWRIFQTADGTAPYQDVTFWKAFYADYPSAVEPEEEYAH